MSQLYQATPTSPALAFPGQQPAQHQQQLAVYNLQQQQQQQCLRYFSFPVIVPHMPATYIQLPQHHGIFNIQHSHPTLGHPQALSVAPPTMALAGPSLSSPQGQAQFVHHAGSHHQPQQQQQQSHHQHQNVTLYGGNNGSIAAIGRGNGQRRLSRGGRRGGSGGGQVRFDCRWWQWRGC